MHKILLQQNINTQDEKDILCYEISYNDSPLYLVDSSKHEKHYEILIDSIHDYNLMPTKAYATNRVSVVSYVPSVNSEEWPQFYLQLCMSHIIASDSFIKKQLDEITYPIKGGWINLDGCTHEVVVSDSDVRDSINIGAYYSDESKAIWHMYEAYLDSNSFLGEEIQVKATSLGDANVLVSFETVPPILANVYAKLLPFVWFEYDREHSLYLDSRFTHVYAKQFKPFLHMEGSAKMDRLKELFEEFTTTLLSLYLHSKVNEIPKFTSNADIIGRIYNTLVRAM